MEPKVKTPKAKIISFVTYISTMKIDSYRIDLETNS